MAAFLARGCASLLLLGWVSAALISAAAADEATSDPAAASPPSSSSSSSPPVFPPSRATDWLQVYQHGDELHVRLLDTPAGTRFSLPSSGDGAERLAFVHQKLQAFVDTFLVDAPLDGLAKVEANLMRQLGEPGNVAAEQNRERWTALLDRVRRLKATKRQEEADAAAAARAAAKHQATPASGSSADASAQQQQQQQPTEADLVAARLAAGVHRAALLQTIVGLAKQAEQEAKIAEPAEKVTRDGKAAAQQQQQQLAAVPIVPDPSVPAATLADAVAALAKKKAEDQRELKYVVGLLSKAPAMPVAAAPQPGARTLVMTSKTGRKFRCTIAHPGNSENVLAEAEEDDGEDDETPTAAAAAAASSTTSGASSSGASTPPTGSSTPALVPKVDGQAQRALEEKGVAGLIRKHLGSNCFTRQVDYWTYEVCAFRRVRQYHRQPENQAVTVDFALGTYTPAGDQLTWTPSGNNLEYTQVFEGGASNRQARVTFRCHHPHERQQQKTLAPNMEHMLVEVKEAKTHQYEFVIATALLCRDEQGRIPAMQPSAASGGASASVGPGHGAAGSAAPASPSPASSETGRLHSSPGRSLLANGRRAKQPHVLELLEPLGQSCLYLNTGWWTYKMCYLKEITQFHRETVQVPVSATTGSGPAGGGVGGGPALQVKTGARSAQEAAANLAAAQAQMTTKLVTTAEYVLGLLPASETLDQLTGATQIVQGTSWETSYVSQQYRDGTVCDLNNRPRRTETRIYCDLHEQQSMVKSVVESATCEYIVVVHTPLLCAHPLFKPDMPKVVEIACEPIDQTPTPTMDAQPKAADAAALIGKVHIRHLTPEAVAAAAARLP